MADVALDKACALSLDIDPDSLRTEPHQYGMKEPVYRTECFPSEGIADDFKKRLQVLKNRPWELRVSRMTDAVPLERVAEFGIALNWNMPRKMAAMCSSAAPLTGLATHAPKISSLTGNEHNSVGPTNGPGWRVKTTVTKFPGYRDPLYKFLNTEQVTGKPCPTAQDTIDAWTTAPPVDITVIKDKAYIVTNGRIAPTDKVTIRNGIHFKLETGEGKQANLKSIQASIKNLTELSK